MNLTQFMERVVEAGIESVKIHSLNGLSPNKAAGAAAGLQRCRSLGSLEQFDAEIEHLNQRLNEAKPDLTMSEFWERRYYVLQVEFVRSVLVVAYIVNGWPGHAALNRAGYSARAAQAYHEALSGESLNQ